MIRATMAVALDTLEYARRLREAGFSEQQAEGQARALAAVMTDSLATKEDLRELNLALASDVRELSLYVRELEKRFELHLEARIADLERRLTFRLGGLMVTGIGAVSVLAKLL